MTNASIKSHLDQSLPRQPVPPLQQTLDRFLQVVEPLYDGQEYRHAQMVLYITVWYCKTILPWVTVYYFVQEAEPLYDEHEYRNAQIVLYIA